MTVFCYCVLDFSAIIQQIKKAVIYLMTGSCCVFIKLRVDLWALKQFFVQLWMIFHVVNPTAIPFVAMLSGHVFQTTTFFFQSFHVKPEPQPDNKPRAVFLWIQVVCLFFNYCLCLCSLVNSLFTLFLLYYSFLCPNLFRGDFPARLGIWRV